MSYRGVMSGKKTSNNCGLCPVKDSNQAFAARLKSILKSVSEYYTDHAALLYGSYPPRDTQSKYNFYFSNRTASCFS